MLIGIVISAMVMAGYLRSLEGVKNVEHGRAMALATFTVTGACVAAALSRLRTRAAWVISIGTILSSFLLIQTPAMNRLLHLQPLHLGRLGARRARGIVRRLPAVSSRFLWQSHQAHYSMTGCSRKTLTCLDGRSSWGKGSFGR